MVECAGLENRYGHPATNDPTESYDFGQKNVSSGLSPNLKNYPDLADLIQAWPDLSADVRKMISGVVKATAAARGNR